MNNSLKSLILIGSTVYISTLHANVAEYFNQIKKDPNSLYEFFKSMPKGGELHYHLAGGAYPETMLKISAQGEYCLDKDSYTLSNETQHCNGIKSKEVLSNPEYFTQTIKSWSMKDFIPGKESGQEHFFNTFSKFMPIVNDYTPQLLSEIIQRAAQQQEQYMEILTLPDNAKSISYGHLIADTPSFDDKKNLLLNNKEFQANIKHTISETDRVLNQARQNMGCDKDPKAKPCSLNIKFLYYVLREQPVNNVFAQTLNAFEAVSRSKGSLVGVNMVQAEDGLLSLKNYREQMKIFQYFHKIYPNVKIALHAGELAPERVAPEDLSFHIHDAVFIGKALRIGHGVAIAYEDDAAQTLKYMAQQHLPVEINLISNQQILNISGVKHPLNYYLSHQVPVVLSTDDEGILRTDLSRQYVEAAIVHHLDYPVLKTINRNTLTYAFIPGDSIWADAAQGSLRSECQDLNSPACKEFLKTSEKALLQWNLEQKLNAFEQKF